MLVILIYLLYKYKKTKLTPQQKKLITFYLEEGKKRKVHPWLMYKKTKNKSLWKDPKNKAVYFTFGKYMFDERSIAKLASTQNKEYIGYKKWLLEKKTGYSRAIKYC